MGNDHEKNVERATKYLMLAREGRVHADPKRDLARRLAANVAYKAIRDKDLLATEEAKKRVNETYADLGAVPVRGGRRADLRADQKYKGAAYIKLTIAGSGYDMWMSEQDDAALQKMMEIQPEHARAKFEAWSPKGSWKPLDDTALGWRRYRGEDLEFMFAGPGGQGWLDDLGGATDWGCNSIAELIDASTHFVSHAIEDMLNVDEPPSKVVVLVRCHSRGAVAGDQAAVKLKKQFKDSLGDRLEIEASILEPVPGPATLSNAVLGRWFKFLGNAVPFVGNTDPYQRLDVSELDQSTVFCSVSSGRILGFDSQQVLGAKRLIISTQDHTAGMAEGLVYNGRRYKGSSFNSLPEGIFLDANENGRSNVPLKLLVDMNEFRAAVDKETSVEARHMAAMKGMAPAEEALAQARSDTKNKSWLKDPLDVRDLQIQGILQSYIDKAAFG